jgi:TPR repeat protein
MCPNAKQGQTLLAFIEKMKWQFLRSGLCEAIGTSYRSAAEFFRDEFYGPESAALVKQMLCRYCASEELAFAELEKRDGEGAFEVFRVLDEEAYILDIRSTQDPGASREDALGGLYYRGDGVRQDYRRACHFYRLASLGGSSIGQFKLGNMFMNGLG